jgi:hypothetical protein
MRNVVRRLMEALYRLTFEVGENQFSTFGSYPEDDSRAPLSPNTGYRARVGDTPDGAAR